MSLKIDPIMIDEKVDIEAALAILQQRFGERLTRSHALREQHAHTTSWVLPQMPDAVIFPRTSEEVADIVRIASEYRMPIIPFGAGSSLEGHVNAPAGGLSVDLMQMDSILEIHQEDLDCVVEPGVTHRQLNNYLRDTGLFFPIDPGADASLGGMVATRASGTNAVRYGTMRDNVINLQVVMADGRIIRTARRAKKSSAGYDLTRLMIGSEGTLGIVTEITLQLSGVPEAISGGFCPFASVEDACNATIMTIQCGIPVARIELLDEIQVQAVNAYANLSLPVQPLLFMEFHGTAASVEEQSRLFGEIASECGGGTFVWATLAEERSKLWRARHDAYWASMALRPGARGLSTDVCVPISRLSECVYETKKDIDKLGLLAPIVGHVGDGNFHVLVLVDMDDADEIKRTEIFLDNLSKRAIDMEGTCTGEHGIGQGKMKYMELEHGPALDIMRDIKKTLDPLNIMNPGKIIALE